MAKFRKKPIVLEAFQWTPSMGEVGGVVFNDRHPDIHQYAYLGKTGNWIVNGLEGGHHLVTPRDWIVTGTKGERWAVKPDIFAETYEPVDSPAPDSGERKGVEKP